jgi:hypothetical protein
MKRLWTISLGLSISVGVAVLTACTPSETGTVASIGRTPVAERTVSPTIPHGVPAIKPTQTGVPAYTLNDVRAYVSTHPLPGTLNRDLNFTIVRIAFLTSAEVSRLLGGESTGFPPTTLLCYVQLQGRFVFAGPPGTTVIFPIGNEVFDARNGNIVMAGGQPSVPS